MQGKAGTGKSALLKQFITNARDSGKRVVVLAPTGLTAANVCQIQIINQSSL